MPDGTTNFQPPPRLALRHIELLTGDPNTSVCIRLLGGMGNRNLTGTVADLWPQIADAQRYGAQVFVVVNGGGHTARSITRIRALFVDADGLPLPAAWHTPPDFITRRGSTHWHAYWLVADLPLTGFRTAQKRLAAHYGTDPTVCDLPRIMRLAGTLHLKDPTRPLLVTIEAGEHARCPEWARSADELLRGLPELAATERAAETSQPSGAPVSLEIIRDTLGYLDPDCDRNEWRDIIAAVRAAPVSDDEDESSRRQLVHEWSEQGSKYKDADDVDRVFDDMAPAEADEAGKIHFGTLVKKARDAGYEGPIDSLTFNEIFAGYLARHAEAEPAEPEESVSYVERLRRIRDAIRPDGGPRYSPPPAPPLFMSAAELDASTFPVEQDIWQGLVLRQLVNLFYADGEAGKTMLSLHLAVARAAGLPALFGHRIEPGPVLMVLCEDAYKRVQPAMRAICAHLGVSPAKLPITFCCRPDDPLLAIIDDKGKTQVTPFLAVLCEQIARLGEPLVVLDTLADIAELNESLRLPPNALTKRVLQPICDVFGATILVTAHPSAAQISNGRLSSGSTSWRNSVRNALGMTVDANGTRHLRNTKDSYGSKASLYLAMRGPIFTAVSAPQGDASKEAGEEAVFRAFLAAQGAIEWKNGLTHTELAERYAGPRPDESDVDALRDWHTKVATQAKALRNKGRSAKWRRYGAEQCLSGGTELIWRWFVPAVPGEAPVNLPDDEEGLRW